MNVLVDYDNIKHQYRSKGLVYIAVRLYHPMREAEAVLADVARVNTDDAWQLLRFVNTWGGVGEPGGVAIGAFEPVSWTRQCLKDLKKLMEMWSQIGKHPAMETLQRLGSGICAPLRTVSPSVRITKRGFEPVFRARTLRQVLYLQLWLSVTEGRQLRRCKGCQALFMFNRQDQQFCSANCRTRINVRRLRLRKSGRS